ncbi:MAG: hypothetical protein Q27BPR15_05560 [Rhodobacter sp. CACIA14H1]|nr:MAG: hypothetical protein Q27BPR15_05560 [Rhodobacter sp. CACIA14H1]
MWPGVRLRMQAGPLATGLGTRGKLCILNDDSTEVFFRPVTKGAVFFQTVTKRAAKRAFAAGIGGG